MSTGFFLYALIASCWSWLSTSGFTALQCCNALGNMTDKMQTSRLCVTVIGGFFCCFSAVKRRFLTALMSSVKLVGLDQNMRLCEYSFGGLAFDFYFFFLHLASPAKWFSTCPPGWTSAPATDRLPMKDVRADLLHAYISWKIFYYERAGCTSTFEIRT